ncbi:MAG: YmdB family metallophosphoesterase [Opitutales bacterium]|nr:YmdB family metallophosphoesterase [Opitutales bacterium]
MRLLFIGDIVGRPGRQAVMGFVQRKRREWDLDVIVANGENAAAGAGITTTIAAELHSAGIDALTLGDHCWDQRGFANEIDSIPYICRPYNLPKQCPGADHLIVPVGEHKLGVVTLLGQTFMKLKSDNPFNAVSGLLRELRKQTDFIFVEMHAEATSEKVAMGWFLDGQVAAVIGTHTHVPTADGRCLPRGTAYLTDAGMSGPYASVLGRDIGAVTLAAQDGLPRRFEVAENDVRISGCVLDLDPKSGLCTKFEQVFEEV